MINALKNPGLVLEGIRNSVKMENGLLSPEDVEIITQRRIICYDCPYYSQNAASDGSEYKVLTGKNFEFNPMYFEGKYCSLCLCKIDYKTASLGANCGIEVVNQEKGTNLELKWQSKK